MAVLRDLALNSRIKFGSIYGEPIVWKVADKNHAGYPADSVTLITDQLVKLLGFDAKEPTNSVIDRAKYGNSRYLYSNLRQWLNSNASAGAWYTPQHTYDAPPNSENSWEFQDVIINPYDTDPGFLNGFTADEQNALLPTSITTGRIVLDDGGGVDTSSDKVFLMSCAEAGVTGEFEGGSKLAIFSDNASRICTITQACYNNSTYKYNISPGSAMDYWLRDPKNSKFTWTRVIKDTGFGDNWSSSSSVFNSSLCYTGNIGLRPVCNIPGTLTISSATDSDGCYTIVFNTPPVISGSDGTLGSFGENIPSYPYTVTDAQGGTVTVTEQLDGRVIRTYNPVLGSPNTLTFSADEWRKVLNGGHTLLITAADSAGAISTRQQAFTKSVTSCSFTMTTALSTDAMPTRCIVNVQGAFPEGCGFTVEICNNGNDASPTWENITSQALTNQKYFFTNKTTTAAQWGVKVRATLSRGTASGDCYISSIGGNYQ